MNLRFLGDEGELMRIAMAPGLRGQGLSRRLMDRMVICPGEGRRGI